MSLIADDCSYVSKQIVTRRKMGNQWPKIRLQRNFSECPKRVIEDAPDYCMGHISYLQVYKDMRCAC